MDTKSYETIKDFKDVIHNRNKDTSFNLEKSDIYQTLMKKEDKILDILSEIDQKDRESKYTFLLSSPLHIIIKKILDTIIDISKEIYDTTDITDIVFILLKKDRLVYTGIIILLFSFFLIIITN